MSKSARNKAKAWIRKAKGQNNVSTRDVKKAIKALGIKSLDSNNDLRKIRQYFQKQSNSNNSNNSGGSNDANKWKDRYNALKASSEKTTEAYSRLGSDYAALKDKYGKAKDQVAEFETAVGDYKTQIADLDEEVSGYKDKVSGLASDYQKNLSTYQTQISDAQKERDNIRAQFEKQTEEYETTKAEADQYREFSVGEQLRGLRGGATSGGSNQTSYGTGSLASGRTGYSSSEQDRDRRLADFVVAEGGATDSVLGREGPVVQIMDRRQYGTGRGRGQVQARYNTGGTGSYYASRFGS